MKTPEARRRDCSSSSMKMPEASDGDRRRLLPLAVRLPFSPMPPQPESCDTSGTRLVLGGSVGGVLAFCFRNSCTVSGVGWSDTPNPDILTRLLLVKKLGTRPGTPWTSPRLDARRFSSHDSWTTRLRNRARNHFQSKWRPYRLWFANSCAAQPVDQPRAPRVQDRRQWKDSKDIEFVKQTLY